MNRTDIEKYIADEYGIAAEYPWISSPKHAVFRHKSNRKWFAIIMNVSSDKIGLNNDNIIDIINVKCDQLLIGSLLTHSGFVPAYHMNKNNWISIILEKISDEETIKWLIDMSYAATAQKPRKLKRRKETRIERISRMEEYFNSLSQAVENKANIIDTNTTFYSMLDDLKAYYENGQWLSDYEADERGELPANLKRGVLSQDGLYNLLCKIESEF